MPNSTRNPMPNWICGGWTLPNVLNDTAQLGMWHRLIGYVAAGNFRISSMAQPNWKLWPGPSKFGERRLEARIAGICLAVFELGFGPQTRIRDYDRRLDGGFGSGRGRPCRYIGLVVLRRMLAQLRGT